MSVILVFLQKAITQGIPLLLGANGEILTEKSGNLNLHIFHPVQNQDGLRQFHTEDM